MKNILYTALAIFFLNIIPNTSIAQRWDEWLVDYSWEYEAIFPDKYSYSDILHLRDTLEIESIDDFVEKNKNKKVIELYHFSYIPEEITLLENIEVIDISWCELNLEEFDKLAKFNELIALNMFHTISSNNKGGVLPESFGSLNKLKYLRMYNNGISKLPESFGNLTSLEVWSFSEQIKLGLPNSIGNLKSLKVVEFYRFSEETDFNENFFKLTQIESMHMRGFMGKDQHLSDFDWSVFTKLEELEVMSKHPHADEPTYIPESMYTLPNLKLIHYSKFDMNKQDFKNYKKHNPKIKFKKYK